MKRRLLAVSLAAAVLATLGGGAYAQGCAMCGTAVSSTTDPLSRGLSYGILFMLGVPNLLFLTVGGWLVYTYRRAGRALPGYPGDESAGNDIESDKGETT